MFLIFFWVTLVWFDGHFGHKMYLYTNLVGKKVKVALKLFLKNLNNKIFLERK